MKAEIRTVSLVRVDGCKPASRRLLRRSSLHLALSGAFAASAGCGPTAHAQTTPAATASAPAAAASAPRKGDDQQLPNVVVTAEKKVASEQKTAISMSVFDANTLSANGVSDLRALSTIAPGLSFSEAGSGASPVLTLRGISSRDTTEIGDPAISVSIDGTYSNRPYALTSTLYDLERVEVLRGPQGTLYGRNATGGALNIVTAAPTKAFGGFGSFELGNYRTQNIEGAVNVPLSSTVQVRAAASQRQHDGYLDNGARQNGNDEDSRSARLSVAFQPTAAFNGLVTIESTAVRGVGQQPLMVPFQTDAAGNVVHSGIALPENPRSFPLLSPAYLDMNQDLARWRFTYELPMVDLTYIGGYAKIDYHHADMQSSAALLQSFVQNESPKTWNHEFRVSGKPGGALEWQAGYYHFDEKSSLFSYDAAPGDAGTVNRLFSFQYATEAKSDAGFGQATYKILDGLRVSAGLRYTKDEKSRDGNLLINTTNTPPIDYFAVPSNTSGDWNKTNYHVGVDWDVQKNVMLYAKYDTAYKAGGFTDIAPYGPENVRGVEVGSKGRFLDQRLQANVAAFYYNYDGQQVTQNVARADGSNGTQILNAGKTRIYGAEAEFVALAGEAGRVHASLQYLNAQFTDFEVASGNANVQLAGNRPAQSPTWTGAIGWEKSWSVPTGYLVSRVDAKYQSSQHFTFWNYGTDYQKGYVWTNASLAYEPDDAKWRVQLWVRNLTNRTVLTDAEDSQFSGSYRYTFAAPRTVGLKASVEW